MTLFRFTLCSIALLVCCIPSVYFAAPSCDIYYPDSIQGHTASSSLEIEDTAQIINDSDNVLTFPTLRDRADGGHNTCNTADCTVSSTFAPALTLPAFESTSSTTNITLNNGTTTIGPGGDYAITEVNNLTVNGSANLTFSASASVYKIANARFVGNSTITLNPGVYWFDFLEILSSSTVIINGPVTIFVNQHFDIEQNATLNATGSASDLAFVGYDKIHLKNNAVVKAVIYGSSEDIEIKDSADFTGAISSGGKVKIKDTATITYENVTGVQIADLCGGTPLVIDHYEIEHDATGSTCADESITVKACFDTACTSLVSGNVSLDFLVDGITESSLTFSGSTTINVSHTTEETATFSLANESVTPDSSLVCDDGSGTSCDMTFSSTGCPVVGSCAVYFPDTIQGHDAASYIKFKKTGTVINDSDNILTFPSLTDDANGGHNTCNTADCTVSSSTTPAFTLPTFTTTITTTDISLNSGTSSIGPDGDYTITEIDQLSISGSANVTFSASASTYIIDEGYFFGDSTITFNPGIYWFNELEIIDNTNIIINGPVTIFVNGQANHFDIEDDATINTGGAAEDLAIVSYSKIHMKKDVVVKAVIYGTGSEIKVEKDAQFTGAISASGKVEIKDSATVTYEDVSGVQVGDLCGGTDTLDHILISHDGSALTCLDETLNIKACANADCSSVATSDVEVTLSDDGTGTSVWSNNPVTIPADSSTGIDVTLTHRTAETITLSASSIPVANHALVCSPVGCEIAFSEAGFILTLDNHQSCSVPKLSIQAVKLSNTGTSCVPAYTGIQSVNFKFNYSDPSSGSTLPILNAISMANANVDKAYNVDFVDANPVELDFQYNDAGEVSITASDNDDAGLSSATITTVVSPAKLIVSTTDASNECEGNYGDCIKFKVAGEIGNTASEFNLTVAAACSDNTPTTNFQLSNIDLTLQLIAPDPADGTNGVLGDVDIDILSGGTATITQSISEVGAFTITATAGDYLGVIAPIPAATSSTIGRFIPDRFSVSVNAPTDIAYFADASCGFTYQGQEFGFGATENPVITITALNSAGAVTRNYGGSGVNNNDFWEMDVAKLATRTYSNQVATFPGSLDFTTLGTVVVAGANNYDGQNTFSIEDDMLTYSKSGVTPVTTSDANFDAEVTLNFTADSLTDEDGVFYDAAVADGTADDFDIIDIGSTNIRWGRWFIDNAFGSELQPLTMTAQAQYFDGSNFILNTDDDSAGVCTTYTPLVNADVTLSTYAAPLASGDTLLPSPLPTISSGLVSLILSAPGAGNEGSLLLTILEPNWMMYDYNGDGTADEASATATFGIFEGKKPVIFWRQTY